MIKKNSYSRYNAVKYATTYALTPNPNFRYFPVINDKSGDCANFVSQCLLAGGAPMKFNSNPWWYIKSGIDRKYDKWSVSWAVANSLYWYLKINQNSKGYGAKGLEVYSTSLLELGDLMFFQDASGNIFHSAIVTSFSDGKPLISHHSFEALNIPYDSSWDAKKIHFLKISI